MMLALLVALTLPRFSPCAHALDQPRPRLTREHQAETAAIIRAVVRETGAADDFGDLLVLVAARESSLQRGLVHRLPADVEANARAWRRLAPVYQSNPAAAEPALWQGYGLFGMNAPIFLQLWSRTADPRALCDAVVDVLVYRTAAERVLRRAGKTIDCPGGRHVLRGTWLEVHGAVSGGSLCPRDDADLRRRAARVKLDLDTPLMIRAVGRAPVDPPRFVADFWARWSPASS
jgi:hypothetical protein